MPDTTTKFTLDELNSIYCDDKNRFVVSLIVGYGGDEADGVGSAREAAFAALELTSDSGWDDTLWYVFDRQTGTMHSFTQDQFAAHEEFGEGWVMASTGEEERASELKVGDKYEDGGDPVRITAITWHGDTVLITGSDPDGNEVAESFDRDTVVSVVDRGDS